MACSNCVVTTVSDGQTKFAALSYESVEEIRTNSSALTTLYHCRDCETYFTLGKSSREPSQENGGRLLPNRDRRRS